MTDPNNNRGVISLVVVGLTTAELQLPPAKDYIRNPERFEFFDTLDNTKRYFINPAGQYQLASGNTSATSKVNGIAPDGTGNIVLAPTDVRALANAIPWNPATNVATPGGTFSTFTPASGVAPPNGFVLLLAIGAGTTNLDGNAQWVAGDLALFIPSLTQWARVTAQLAYATLADGSTVDLTTFNAPLASALAVLNAALNVQTINAQTGTSYTLTSADAGKVVDMNNASANTLTIPLNASVAFPVGTVVTVRQAGAGATTIAFSGTVQKPSARTLTISAQYESATLTKMATDTWWIQVN